MKVKSIITGFGLVAGLEYEVIFEYDTVYEIILQHGHVVCRNKDFFELV